MLTLVAFAGSAQANKVTYSGGGTKNPKIGFRFDLSGKECPDGPDCFDKAKLKHVMAAPYPFPICPEPLWDSAFTLGNPNTGKEATVKVKEDRSFKAKDGNVSDETDVITVEGQFARSGKSARGTFEVVRQGVCSTGVVPWKVTIYHR